MNSVRQKFFCLFCIILLFLLINNYKVNADDFDIIVNNIANEIDKRIEKDSKVAIVDFKDLNGLITHFGRYLSEQISTKMINNKKFTVIDRGSLNFVLNEQKIQLSGLVSDRDQIKFGNLVGANKIVYGTITETKQEIELNIKIVDVEKNTLLEGFNYSFQKDTKIVQLISTVVQSEEALQKELENYRNKVLQEIEEERKIKIESIKKEEENKKKELIEIEKEIREKSIIIADYEKKKKELFEKQSYIKKIHSELDKLNMTVEEPLKFGMTLEQVKYIFGETKVKCVKDYGSDNWYMIGRYYLMFEKGILTKLVLGGGEITNYIEADIRVLNILKN